MHIKIASLSILINNLHVPIKYIIIVTRIYLKIDKYLIHRIISAKPHTLNEAEAKLLYLMALITSSKADFNQVEISTALDTLRPFRNMMTLTRSTNSVGRRIEPRPE